MKYSRFKLVWSLKSCWNWSAYFKTNYAIRRIDQWSFLRCGHYVLVILVVFEWLRKKGKGSSFSYLKTQTRIITFQVSKLFPLSYRPSSSLIHLTMSDNNKLLWLSCHPSPFTSKMSPLEFVGFFKNRFW